MHDYLYFLLGSLPLLVMIVLILKIKTPIHHAVLITLVLTLVITAVFWHTPLRTLGLAVSYGVLKGLADYHRHSRGYLQL
jgi:lactate permease